MKIYWDIEQGTVEWHRLRRGIPTASQFSQIITPKQGKLSEGRHKYACRLLAERLMHWQAQSLDGLEHIEAGKTNEPLAIRQLEFVHDIQTRTVGFITSNDGRVGASPDRLTVDVHVPVEVKSPTPPIQMQYLMFGLDDAYRCQVQGQIWLAEQDRGLFYAYNPRMPELLLPIDRDEAFIGKLAAAVDQFCDELDALDDRARRLGVYQMFPERTPAEAEYDANLRNAPLTSEAELEELLTGAIGDKLTWAP